MDDSQPPSQKKILIIRLSSIGDIVLTTPVIRTVKNQLENIELHFLVSRNNKSVIDHNPYIDKVHLYTGDYPSLIEELKSENFDYVIDLQKNRKSKKISRHLKSTYYSYNKYNFAKWIYVNFKINFLPDNHLVDRYFNAVSALSVKNDGQGLDFFISSDEEYEEDDLPIVFEDGFVAIALGSLHGTKRIPFQKIIEIATILHKPIMLLGGNDVKSIGDEIVTHLGERAYNSCGKLSLAQSASIIEQCDCVLTGDTGLMHIAAALNKPIASLWGNTVPEFGMYPYMPNHPFLFRIFEVPSLPCRPCSKLGYKKCPHKHFKCMNNISAIEVAEWINRFLV